MGYLNQYSFSSEYELNYKYRFVTYVSSRFASKDNI